MAMSQLSHSRPTTGQLGPPRSRPFPKLGPEPVPRCIQPERRRLSRGCPERPSRREETSPPATLRTHGAVGRRLEARVAAARLTGEGPAGPIARVGLSQCAPTVAVRPSAASPRCIDVPRVQQCAVCARVPSAARARALSEATTTRPCRCKCLCGGGAQRGETRVELRFACACAWCRST